jgi:hypothetical protein
LFALGLAPREKALRVLDVDALYRGPAAGAGRWFGVVLLRLYGTWRALWARVGERVAHAVEHLTRSCDRPYRGVSWGAVQFLALAAAIAVALMWPSV